MNPYLTPSEQEQIQERFPEPEIMSTNIGYVSVDELNLNSVAIARVAFNGIYTVEHLRKFIHRKNAKKDLGAGTFNHVCRVLNRNEGLPNRRKPPASSTLPN
jgi:hypothetical protein